MKLAILQAGYNINDGSGGELNGLIEYDDAFPGLPNQVVNVTWDNQTQTDWVLTIISGGNPPLKTTIRKNRSGSENRQAILGGYVGEPLLIEIGTR